MPPSHIAVICANCKTPTTALGSARRFACRSCGGSNEYIKCKGCKGSIQVMASWPQVTHHLCGTTFQNPRASPTVPAPTTIAPGASNPGPSRGAWIGIAAVVLVVLYAIGNNDDSDSQRTPQTDTASFSVATCSATWEQLDASTAAQLGPRSEFIDFCTSPGAKAFMCDYDPSIREC